MAKLYVGGKLRLWFVVRGATILGGVSGDGLSADAFEGSASSVAAIVGAAVVVAVTTGIVSETDCGTFCFDRDVAFAGNGCGFVFLSNTFFLTTTGFAAIFDVCFCCAGFC